MKKTIAVVAMVAILGAAGSAYAGLVAYNDLVYPDSGGTAEQNYRVNYYTTGIVPGREPFTLNNEGNSGPLTDYYTGLETNVTVTILSTGTELWRMWYFDRGFWYGGMNAAEGTPAHDVFAVNNYGWVETRGALYPTSTAGMEVAYAFAGLNPSSTYELVVYGGWSHIEFGGPFGGGVQLEIQGDNGCTNTTPAGPLVIVTDDHTTFMSTIANGYSGVDVAYGDIASWIVTPDPSGFFQLVASVPPGGEGFPPQLFRLVEIETVIPEPAGLGLIGLSLLAVRKRRR